MYGVIRVPDEVTVLADSHPDLVPWLFKTLKHHHSPDLLVKKRPHILQFEAAADTITPIRSSTVASKAFYEVVRDMADGQVSWWYWKYQWHRTRPRHRFPARFTYHGREFIAYRAGNNMNSGNYRIADLAAGRIRGARSGEDVAYTLRMMTDGLRAAPLALNLGDACGARRMAIKMLKEGKDVLNTCA